MHRTTESKVLSCRIDPVQQEILANAGCFSHAQDAIIREHRALQAHGATISQWHQVASIAPHTRSGVGTFHEITTQINHLAQYCVDEACGTAMSLALGPLHGVVNHCVIGHVAKQEQLRTRRKQCCLHARVHIFPASIDACACDGSQRHPPMRHRVFNGACQRNITSIKSNAVRSGRNTHVNKLKIRKATRLPREAVKGRNAGRRWC